MVLPLPEQKLRVTTFFRTIAGKTGQIIKFSRMKYIIRLLSTSPRKLHLQNFFDFRAWKKFFEIIYAYYAFFASICNLKFKEMFLCGILLLLDFEKKIAFRIMRFAFAFSHFRIFALCECDAFASHSHRDFAEPSHSHRIRIRFLRSRRIRIAFAFEDECEFTSLLMTGSIGKSGDMEERRRFLKSSVRT